MASQIDTSKPASGNASTSDERQNWSYAHTEIEALQAGTGLTDGVVTNAKLANMTASTIKARVTQSTGAPEDATVAQLRAILDPAPQVVNAQTGTTYTLLMSDKGKLVTLTNASPVTVTVETSTATWAAGDRVDLLNLGAGAVTVSGSGVTVSKQSTQTAVLAQYAGASLVFITDSTAVLIGGMGTA